jgi:hypothetical protein
VQIAFETSGVLSSFSLQAAVPLYQKHLCANVTCLKEAFAVEQLKIANPTVQALSQNDP